MTIHLKLCGVLLILLALAHPAFDRYLGWSQETARLSTLTRQVFHVHVFFISITLLMMGLLSLLYAEELQQPTPLARAVLAGFAVFWGLRALAQWFVYDVSLWRGSTFRTAMHAAFSLLWIYLAWTYTLALF